MSSLRRSLPLLLALLLAGCSAYHLGSGPAEVRNIEVKPVLNSTPIAGVHATLHQALVTALASDNRLRLRVGGEPLETEVVSLERQAASQAPNDALVAGQFKVTLTIRCTLRSADGRSVRFASRPFSASVILPASGDLASAERSALPRLTTELATQVRDAAAGSW